jgi:hypothetical protein
MFPIGPQLDAALNDRTLEQTCHVQLGKGQKPILEAVHETVNDLLERKGLEALI